MTDTTWDAPEATLQKIGRWLIIVGILVWGVWLAVRLAGGRPQVQYFLPFHLLGVVPGSVLSRWSTVRRWMRK